MDLDSEPGSERQNLAAERRDQFSETEPEPAAAARSNSRFLAKIVAVSLLAHGCLVLAILLLDHSRDPTEGPREIPVEVVTEPPPPPPAPKPAAPQAGEKSTTPHEAMQAPSSEPQQKPETAANPKPANEAMSAPHPAEKSAAQQKPGTQAKSAARQKSAKGGSSAPSKPTHKDTAKNEIAREHPPAAKPEGGPARQDGGSENRWAAQPGLTLPFDTGPDRFRAVAVPLPSESDGESISYKVIVFSNMARVKHYPDSAIQRGAKGIAVIGFVLDENGGVVSVVLLRSSGDADLDAESVALVNRAAPFPPPPPGAERSFAAEVAFGMEH
jgi:colicin import membrane protein